jgi:hypothetical protein
VTNKDNGTMTIKLLSVDEAVLELVKIAEVYEQNRYQAQAAMVNQQLSIKGLAAVNVGITRAQTAILQALEALKPGSTADTAWLPWITQHRQDAPAPTLTFGEGNNHCGYCNANDTVEYEPSRSELYVEGWVSLPARLKCRECDMEADVDHVG